MTMAYSPPMPSEEERKKWPCRFMLFSTTENEVQSIMSQWKGDLDKMPVEEMKKAVEQTVDRCFEHLKNCTMRVTVLHYNEIRNTWPVYSTYSSHTRTWSY